jgi:chemotaxis protein methyltransferase CheR
MVKLIELTSGEFKKLAKLIYEKTGIHLPDSKATLLGNRLRRRLRALDLDSFDAYHKLLRVKASYEEELPHFLSAVTTNETYFFRNTNLWTFIQKKWIPEIVESRRKKPKPTVRIWSAASSSGEEAYSAGICLREALPNFAMWNVSIVGSDISDRVLERARAGVYGEYAVARMPKPLLSKWFTKKDEEYALKKDVQKLVTFKFHNLRDAMTPGNFDLVFLRNVLMYFDTEMKRKVLKNVAEAVAPGGYLVIGDVDPVRNDKELSAIVAMDYQGPNLYRKPQRVAVGTGESK